MNLLKVCLRVLTIGALCCRAQNCVRLSGSLQVASLASFHSRRKFGRKPGLMSHTFCCCCVFPHFFLPQNIIHFFQLLRKLQSNLQHTHIEQTYHDLDHMYCNRFENTSREEKSRHPRLQALKVQRQKVLHTTIQAWCSKHDHFVLQHA